MYVHTYIYVYTYVNTDPKICKLKLCSQLHPINPACKPGATLPHG